MRIFLIGFMGCGKTYSGKRLAARLGFPFIDLDDWIESNLQMTIGEIFLKKGEAAFRIIERDALREMLRFPEGVIACGGGAPCFFDNMAWMNAHGLTIYLDTPVSILSRRLAAEKARRPLIAEITENELEEFIEKKLQERTVFYEQATICYRQKEGRDTVADLHQRLIGIS